MKLVIAEKPSVAMSLAAVLGATERKDGYLEGSGYLVSWCVGHLLELAQPEAYKEQYAKWRYEDLPILPENWKYEVPKDKKTQLALLCRLMKDKRVDSVVCSTGISHYRRGHLHETENMPCVWKGISSYNQPGILFRCLPGLCKTEIRAGTQTPEAAKPTMICPQLSLKSP